jgi:hypothetical protein
VQVLVGSAPAAAQRIFSNTAVDPKAAENRKRKEREKNSLYVHTCVKIPHSTVATQYAGLPRF